MRSESDLGPVIGGVEPIRPVRKLFRLHEAERAAHRAAGISRGSAVGFAIVCAIALVLLVLWMLAGLATRPAAAHGPAEWIQRGNFKNSAGELCCGERDCGEMIAGKVTATAHGYRVDARFRIIMPDGKIVIDEVHETVPYEEATPSPDGVYWRCRWGGMRKCFFAPPGST